MKDQRPYYATRAELRAIDEGLRGKPAPAKMVRAVLGRFSPKLRIRAGTVKLTDTVYYGVKDQGAKNARLTPLELAKD